MIQFTTLRKQAACIVAFVAVLLLTGVSFAQTVQSIQAGPLRPNLGTASTYAIFTGGGAINNTGLSKLTGDVGQDGAYAFNGFPPGTYTGTLNRNNGASALAKSDLLTAWTTNAAVTCGFVLGVGIVNGQSFDPAVYCSGGATTTTGNITFDAHGDASAIFIVKIGGQLSANAGTHILLANNALATNIYWFVDGAVNIADNSTFKGVIVARGAISFLGTSSLDGRALVAPAGAINISANSMGPVPPGSGNNITVTHPAQGDTIKGGTQNYQITWTGTGIVSKKIFEYSLDSGLTWKTIDTITADVFSHNWNVPDTISKKALVRITDGSGLKGISGLFTIVSSKTPGAIVVVHPMLGEMIMGGMQNYQITWTGLGITSKKTFELSLDSGLTWVAIGTLTADVFSFNWNVPDTASKNAFIRITDQNNLKGISGLFTILSSKSPSINVVKPALGEVITGGTQNYQITWTGAGITAKKTFDLSLDGGLTWTMIGTITADVLNFNWNVPDTASTLAVIRITDNNGLVGKSGLFTIKSSKGNAGSIVITHPVLGEVIDGGTQNFSITFVATNTSQLKLFEYSLDAGVTWVTIGYLNSDAQTYNWAEVPNIATTQALVRITDANGVMGISGLFTIKTIPGIGSINSLTLSGLDSKSNIGNNKVLGISWTFTPDIGTSVDVAYSIDYTVSWIPIKTVTVSESPTASWTTPIGLGGYFNPVFIRVTSTKGMTMTSIPFSIGTNASVSSDGPKNGYSVSNYPNPTSSQTMINFILPVSSDVTLTITDALGRKIGTIVTQHFDAGIYNIPFDASKLSVGMYNYILQAGSTRIIGKMTIVK